MVIVVKVGTSSITDALGTVSVPAIERLCRDVARLRTRGDRVVIVSSGAIAAGLPALGMTAHSGGTDPTPAGAGFRGVDLATLQAVSAVGQSRLLRVYDDVLSGHGLVGGQVLL